MLKAFGIDLGHDRPGDQRPARSIIGLLIGVIATMVSGFVPGPPRDARGAGDGDARQRHARRRPAAPAADRRLAGADGRRRARRSSAGLFGGTDSGSGDASLLGLGAAADDVRRRVPGAAARAAAGARASARRWPASRACTGVLARENAIRQPQRTAVTAAALMVGLALVVLVTIFAAGLQRLDRQGDRQAGHRRADRRRTRTASRRSRRRWPTR